MTKKFNYLYKTTNIVNGKIYIGVHSTNDLDDGYIGCGVKRQSDALSKSKKSRFYGFCHAVSKYGYDNFKKEILQFFESKEEAYAKEMEIVNLDFVSKKNNYNIKVGGIVPPSCKGIKRTKDFKKQKSKQIKGHIDVLIKTHSKEYVVINLNNNEVHKVKNLADFCRKNKVRETQMRAVSLNRSKCTKDKWWCCKLENWNGKIPKLTNKLYHKTGNIVEYVTLKEACILTGCDKSNLSKVIRGKARQTKGWSCKKW